MATVVLERCTGCNICIPYCPVGAISADERKVSIDRRVCTECGVCYRNPVCPKHAILPGPYETFGDTFKHVLSDPTETVEATGITGRGTEECKTNDVTGRYPRHRVGFTIDMGRPGIGVYLRDVETVARAVVAAGLELEPPHRNPLASIFDNLQDPRLKEGLADVHLLSIIIEGTCRVEDVGAVLKALQEVQHQIDTVFSVGMVLRVDPSGYHPALEELVRHGIPKPMRGKVNVGLGRPLVDA
ncbi:MAG: 4Fe-4S binding protein [Armatimonadota bacterium]|nr:4Fe-4S binding protein [Armatimonadota bacterium]MDR5702174.1 4Fe-4S binding protein [Armatimonadota bacterium]MDR7433938.1 4Fe-4S binding protein [Armatimonadota bacterium]